MSRKLCRWHFLFLVCMLLTSCQTSPPSPDNTPESGAAQFIWGSFYDTDIDLNSFFGTDHAVMVRFMPQYELTFEAPVISNGSTPTATTYSVGTEVVCLDSSSPCKHAQLAAGVFLRLGSDKFT
jgi:hypothetical protein